MRFQITKQLLQMRSLIDSLIKTLLRYARFCANEKPYICETFLVFFRIQGRVTGQIIGNSILLLLQRNGIDLSKCHAQACDRTSAMSIEASGAISVIKKEQPLVAEFTHCQNHVLNLAISLRVKISL